MNEKVWLFQSKIIIITGVKTWSILYYEGLHACLFFTNCLCASHRSHNVITGVAQVLLFWVVHFAAADWYFKVALLRQPVDAENRLKYCWPTDGWTLCRIRVQRPWLLLFIAKGKIQVAKHKFPSTIIGSQWKCQGHWQSKNKLLLDYYNTVCPCCKI